MVDRYTRTVPTHDGPGEIDLLPADSCKETLGVFTCPSGSSSGHFTKISDKAKLWISRMQSGYLPVSFNRTSYIYQLWTSIRYGIVGALPADMQEASDFLSDTNRALLPLLGVNRQVGAHLIVPS